MKKLLISSFLLCLLLAGCAQEAGPSPLACNQDMAAYLGTTYGAFREQGGGEAALYHANLFTAQIPGAAVTAVFAADYDADLAVSSLADTNLLVRLEGRLGDLLNGLTEEMTLDDFSDRIAEDGTAPAYQIEEGGGTLYYVADRYAVVSFADGLTLHISLEQQSEKVGPDSYAWLF